MDDTTDVTGPERLTVGQLADRSGLTPRTLRHYDRSGVFCPAEVDPDGRRWYAAGQLPAADLIARLRSVGVPLDDVRRCLAADGDHAVVAEVLAAHDRRLESRQTRVMGDRHRIAHLLQTEVVASEPAAPPVPRRPVEPAPVVDERRLAVDLFNGVWALLEVEDRSAEQDDRLVHRAHASRHHWEQAGTAVNLVRGEWLCSRVYAVLRRPEPALHHAARALELCREHGIGDWDLAFAHEARARAHAVAGDTAAATAAVDDARAAATDIADPADRKLLEQDLGTLPVPL